MSPSVAGPGQRAATALRLAGTPAVGDRAPGRTQILPPLRGSVPRLFPTGRDGSPPSSEELACLEKRYTEVLPFIYDFRVPFDNNLVERDLRPGQCSRRSPAPSGVSPVRGPACRQVGLVPHPRLHLDRA